MAWLLGDGFDFYSVTADAAVPGTVWDNTFTNPGAINSSITRFGVGNSVALASTAIFASFAFANSTTIYVNFAFMPNTTVGSGNTALGGFFLTDGNPIAANIQCGVFIRQSGEIMVVSNSAYNAIAVSPKLSAIAQNVWVHYQIKVVINNTTGSVEVRLNGNPTADYLVTGLNTRAATANNYCNHLYITNGTSLNSANVDDFYAFNDLGAAPNTWQGDVRAVQQMPSADNSVSWTPDTGTSRFPRVNEVRQNGDTSYVSTSGIGNIDQYNVTPLAVTPLSIIAVQTKMVTRMDDAGPHQVKSRLTSGATASDSATLTLSTNYQWLQQVYAVDPNTAAAWSAANLNAVKIGPVDVL